MIRVLHVYMWGLHYGSGVESVLMNYYRHIDRSQVQFDFLLHCDVPTDYDAEVESMGGRIYRLPERMMYRDFCGWRKALVEKFKEIKPDIVHVHFTNMGRFVIQAAEKAGIKIRIAHSHGADVTESRLKHLIRWGYNWIYPWRATHYFACSKLAGDWLFGKKEGSRVVYNAINCEHFSFSRKDRDEIRSALNIPKTAWVLGQVGRIDANKNQLFSIEVFEKILERDPYAVFLIVGDGVGRAALESKISEKKMEKQIILLGIRIDIPALMSAMDALIQPSFHEGLSITCIEAQQNGLSCFLSDTLPEEAIVSDHAFKLSLSVDARVWAETVYKFGRDRVFNRGSLLNTSWDITRSAKDLSQFYIQTVKENG